MFLFALAVPTFIFLYLVHITPIITQIKTFNIPIPPMTKIRVIHDADIVFDVFGFIAAVSTCSSAVVCCKDEFNEGYCVATFVSIMAVSDVVVTVGSAVVGSTNVRIQYDDRKGDGIINYK
eukprot:TRINITY_DN3642_c0_g1_i1.p1 TRINITY_DN3642_c0_g1~~TRINITY_DN3642_c0_g1_i1.p1  ORF type:complete len:121 (-),score=26.14 TRINITY_DN3642_c0_g1_i1:54-416(-)